jgi:hypothetical protein
MHTHAHAPGRSHAGIGGPARAGAHTSALPEVRAGAAPALPDAAPERTRQHGRTARWTLPLLIGIAYGAYAWFLARDERFTVGAAVVGLVAGAAAALVSFVLVRLRPPLAPELRAAAYGAAFGCALGYLDSLTGPSVLWSSVLGLGLAAGVVPVVFYHLHTHED